MATKGGGCPPLLGLWSIKHNSVLILMNVIFQHGSSKSPAWEEAGEKKKNPTAMPFPGKKKKNF